MKTRIVTWLTNSPAQVSTKVWKEWTEAPSARSKFDAVLKILTESGLTSAQARQIEVMWRSRFSQD